jgi:hypothetical protein
MDIRESHLPPMKALFSIHLEHGINYELSKGEIVVFVFSEAEIPRGEYSINYKSCFRA